MRLSEIKSILEETGMPVAYHHFQEGKAPALPFVCYLYEGSENFQADGIVYEEMANISVELYSRGKDLNAEAKIKEALTAHGIAWEQSEEYIESEKVFENIFTISINMED